MAFDFGNQIVTHVFFSLVPTNCERDLLDAQGEGMMQRKLT
jgi:hypothetical protein